VLPLLLACSSVTKDIAVESEVGPASDFSRYQTYDWGDATTVLNDPDGHWSAPGFNAVEFMVAQIDTALQKRGLTRQATDSDLLASIGTGINMEYVDSAKMATIPKGALVLVLVDNASGNLAWMGTATGNVQGHPDDDTVRTRLTHAVSEMIKQMPK
jgi:hypothetical protein